jgi:hypothetical protein
LAVPFPVEQRLKLAFLQRLKKMTKLRRRMRLWGAAGAVCAVLASAPLVYFLVTGSLPAVSFDSSHYVSDDWAFVIGAVAAGLFGSTVFYGQLKRDRDKFEKLRAGAVEMLQSGTPVCDCRWTVCSCKDELADEMHEKYDINLFY